MTGSHLGYDGPGSGMYNFYAKFLSQESSTEYLRQDLSRVGWGCLHSELIGAFYNTGA